MRPLLLQETLFPVLPDIEDTETRAHTPEQKNLSEPHSCSVYLDQIYNFITKEINTIFVQFPKLGNQCLRFSTCIILAVVCCLPVEDESYAWRHDNADTQNDHDYILDV